MPVPISTVVSIRSRLIKAGQTGLELNGLLLTESELIAPGTVVLEFLDLSSVADFFGVESKEYEAAGIYFASYENSFKLPERLYFARRLKQAEAPFLVGGKVTALVSDIIAVTDPEITLTLGTAEATIKPVLTDLTSYSAIAEALQTSIRANAEGAADWTSATVVFSSNTGGFVITGGVTGISSMISFASGNLSEILSLTADRGAFLSQGADAMTPAENMQSIIDKTDNFVSFSTIYEAEDEHEDFQAWSALQSDRYMYVAHSVASALTVKGSINNIASKWQENAAAGAIIVYGDVKYSAFIMSIFASVDYNRENGAVITAMFKSSSNLAFNVDSKAIYDALTEKGVNNYSRYAENNASFRFLAPGSTYDKWAWIDTFMHAVWLRANLQLSLLTLLTNTGALAYTEDGYTLIRGAMLDVIGQGRKSGVIQDGVSLSNAQKVQINKEAGLEIADAIEQNGYYLQVLDPGAAVRAARKSPIINLWYTYGGAIQRIDASATAME